MGDREPRIVSPTRDKFDFACFKDFLNKLGPKVFPNIDPIDALVAVAEDFVLKRLKDFGKQH